MVGHLCVVVQHSACVHQRQRCSALRVKGLVLVRLHANVTSATSGRSSLVVQVCEGADGGARDQALQGVHWNVNLLQQASCGFRFVRTLRTLHCRVGRSCQRHIPRHIVGRNGQAVHQVVGSLCGVLDIVVGCPGMPGRGTGHLEKLGVVRLRSA